ncbi:MAG: hypothetical protein K2P81_05780, partial [Bacteriovoracaceae bacterium]|nr:hypothetical protein [Bacteriovoracaceae bacterium]
MKKQLVLVAGLAVLATPAMASKARLQALGESANGSQYINDNRNIFLNASSVNAHKDLVTFETGASSSTTDGADAPRAEGGFYFGNGNLVYGAQLGGQSDTSHALRSAGLAGATDVAESNGVDLFVGGDAGIKWGASLFHTSSTDKQTTTANDMKSQSAMRARLGVSQGNWDAFANINLTNELKQFDGDKFKGKLGYQLGGSYLLNDYRIFANYSDLTGEGTVSGTKNDVSLNQMEVGVGRTAKLNDKASLFTKVSYKSIVAENDAATAGNAGNFSSKKTTTTTLPVVVGLEYDAASWLTVRGSVGQNVFISEVKGQDKKSVENSTVVNAGTTLKFGDF